VNKKERVQNLPVTDLPASFADMRVLILTGRNPKRYEDSLQRFGWHHVTALDPFEKHEHHVKQVMEQHDLVVLCVNCVPHSVIYMIENRSDPKYQFTSVRNERLIHELLLEAAEELMKQKQKGSVAQ
jgi:hypothetical protein